MAFDLRVAPTMRNWRRTKSPPSPGRPGVSPLGFTLLLAAILCIAALLRVYRLDAQSLWNDEGNSARIAERSVDLIVEGAAGDIHPPGYYLLLHVWRSLFGHSEFALRSLSAVAGLALVVATCLLGRRLFGPAVGLMAAFLSAISPFAVYYSQEARMYALLGALAATSTCVTLLILDEPSGGQRAWWILRPVAYSLLGAAGLYTHYAFVFVLLTHNVVFGMTWLVECVRFGPRGRSLVRWAGAQLGAGLLYLPWLPTALDAAGWSSAGGEYELGSATLDVLRVLAVGVTQSLEHAGPAILASVALLIVGLYPRSDWPERTDGRLRGWWGTAAVAVYLIVPLGLFFGFDLYKPAWLKFLVILLAPYHILVAKGVRTVAGFPSRIRVWPQLQHRATRAVVSGILIMAVAVLAYPSLHNLYFEPTYARDDYRQLAADLLERWRPGDAVVLNAPNQWEVFTYYYPDRDVYPAPYRPRPGGASSFLDPLLDEYERVFVLYWGDAESDPKKRIESWVAQHAYKAGDQWYGDVRLATYGVGPLPQEPDVALDVRFGERVGLQGFSLPDHAFAPGEIIPVTLFWKALGDVENAYKVSVQMLDADDERGLISQIDSVPGDGLAPTTSWQAGSSLVDRYGVLVPEDALPGRWSLVVVVYQAADGRRLGVERTSERVGDVLPLSDVVVGPEE